MKKILFDQSIPIACNFIISNVGDNKYTITLIRDSFGCLSIVLPDQAFSENTSLENLSGELHELLGAYSAGKNQVLLKESDLIDREDVLESPDRVRLHENKNIWIVDRLLTNQDWLREPLTQNPPLPTAVAFSIKGGVGRTTAFALWAWSLARSGKSVILIDLDLEAPGIAGLLLGEDRLPDFGLVDWLVESLAGNADEDLLSKCLVDCDLASGEPGRIRVLPAFGVKTKDYINKLGRIYMPTYEKKLSSFVGLAERLAMLLTQISNLVDRPDLVLLDSRAGLHDIGAAAVTRLGAEAFLFARDDYQSWQAYRQLFSHLSASRNISIGMPDNDLRWHMKMIGAQLDPTESAKLTFIDNSYGVWSDELYDAGLSSEEEDAIREKGGVIPQIFVREDDNAPHSPFVVHFDSRVKSFDLINVENRPDWRMIEAAFGEFFEEAAARIFPMQESQINA